MAIMAQAACGGIFRTLFLIIGALCVLGSKSDVPEFPPKDPLGRPITDEAPTEYHRFCEYAYYIRHPTYSGYAEVDGKLGSYMYYAYYEAEHHGDTDKTPILLWLQGGPGCASTFGAFYELGPNIFDDTGRHKWKPRLIHNPGSWNKIFGLLIIDQPIGTGYSLVGKDQIPGDEIGVATHLYTALRNFFARHHHLQHRPFYITGESYGGKYVPSIAHYILQAEQAHSSGKHGRKPMKVTRPIGHHVQRPNFNFTGIAIGNAWVDPVIQTVQIADVVHRLGLVAGSGKELVQNLTAEVLALVDAGEWKQAHKKRSHMISVLEHLSGVGTLLDVRRYEPYDSSQAVDRLLNCHEVKHRLQADKNVRYESCSAKVNEALSADVMKSVANLIPDILDAVPVLLYQGQFDAQDGPSSNEAWVGNLEWSGRDQFLASNASLWRGPLGDVQGWYKLQFPLSQVVIRNAGHLVPHDQPIAALEMIAGWVYLTLTNKNVQLGPVPRPLLEEGWDEEILDQVTFGPYVNADGAIDPEDNDESDDEGDENDGMQHKVEVGKRHKDHHEGHHEDHHEGHHEDHHEGHHGHDHDDGDNKHHKNGDHGNGDDHDDEEDKDNDFIFAVRYGEDNGSWETGDGDEGEGDESKEQGELNGDAEDAGARPSRISRFLL